MSTSAVTREGIRGDRPGREAVVGSGGGRRSGRRRRDESMVPEARFATYYDKPVIKQPTWQARYIASYFWLGGLAGASSVLAAGADLSGRPTLTRGLRVGAGVATAGSLYGLIKDLGRPERFVYMLRALKVTSPMSVGSWCLAAYAPGALAAAGLATVNRLPGLSRAAGLTAALVGPAVAAYTGALVSNTAVPAWHDGYREMPFVFVGSAAASAGGLGLLVAPLAEAGPARRAALAGAALELAMSQRLEHGLHDVVAEAYHKGRGGWLMRGAKALTGAGALTAATYGRWDRRAAAGAGAALLAGTALTRFGIFEAGKQSATDPRHTVVPQRERLNQATSAPPASATESEHAGSGQPASGQPGSGQVGTGQAES